MKPTPLRSDAARRRTAVLRAAQALFEEHGVDVPLDLIAQAAGVGRATLYRSFPDRESLLAALLDSELEEFAGRLEATDLEHNPLELVDAIGDMTLNNAALLAYWRTTSPDSPGRKSIHAKFQRITKRAHCRMMRSKEVRPDLTADDLFLIAVMLGGAHRGNNTKERAQSSQRARVLLKASIRNPNASS